MDAGNAQACGRSRRGRRRRRAGTRGRGRGALLVPACGVDDVRLGRLADDEAHGSAGLVQALLDAGAHHLPGLAGVRVALKLGEAAVELGDLRLGERQLAGLGGDAVPEVLGELDALGDGEPEMSRSVLRMASVSRARGRTQHPSGGHWPHALLYR